MIVECSSETDDADRGYDALDGRCRCVLSGCRSLAAPVGVRGRAEEVAMGLFLRRRRPLMRLAAGAAVGGAAYHAGRRREQEDMVNDQAQASYAASEAPPAAPTAAPPTPAPAADPTSELERLAQLHASGSLTDEEFTAAKARLLSV
jgi:hypothetical protein